MKGNKNKIGHKAILKVLKDEIKDTTNIQWHGLDIEVKGTLPFEDAIEFSNSVADLCFLEDGEYVPEMFDFAVRSYVIEFFTNISLPGDLVRRYEVAYKTDLFMLILDHVGGQYYELVSCARERVESRRKIDEEDIKRRLTEIANKFDKIGEDLANTFGAIDADTLQAVVRAAAKLENVTEESVVKAYSEEFFKSGGKHE